jgi:hypothetical protein
MSQSGVNSACVPAPGGQRDRAESSVSGGASVDAGTAHAARHGRRNLALVGSIHVVTACHDHSRRNCRAPFRRRSTALPRLERARTVSSCFMDDSRPRHRRDFGGDLGAHGPALTGTSRTSKMNLLLPSGLHATSTAGGSTSTPSSAGTSPASARQAPVVRYAAWLSMNPCGKTPRRVHRVAAVI